MPRMRWENEGLSNSELLAPLFQSWDNFMQWISHYLTVAICNNFSVIAHVTVSKHI